jgi:drug/metabolite transporter (DMT)-like permease
MFAALLATLLFATSAVSGFRTAKQIGGLEANFWRIMLATIFLTAWAFTKGCGFAGAPGWFMLSGFFGIGLGDTAYFQSLLRLGTRRTVLLCQCLTAPFSALVEWIWLGNKLNLAEIACIAVILAGVAIVMAPDDHMKIAPRDWKIGITACVFGAIAAAFANVLIRKAFEVAHADGMDPDAGSTGYQRMIGGFWIPAIALFAFKGRYAHEHGGLMEEKTIQIARDKWSRLWPWVLINALAGQTLGVTCMQWALKTTPAGIVAAVISTTPIILLPMTRYFEKEKITHRAVLGAFVSVAGVMGLALWR